MQIFIRDHFFHECDLTKVFLDLMNGIMKD